MAHLLVLHGPNLNQLGKREALWYGHLNLEQINHLLVEHAHMRQHQLTARQSNAEHELVDWIHDAPSSCDMMVINAASLTHTSIALRDALILSSLPFIEVHLSNVYAREPFRHHSYLADKAVGVIAGFGAMSYQLAVEAADHYLRTTHGES